jgi:hypothetical protein
MRSTGFFHPLQRENREFLRSFARSMFPADQLALEQVLDRLEHGEPSSRRPASIFDVLSSVLNR